MSKDKEQQGCFGSCSPCLGSGQPTDPRESKSKHRSSCWSWCSGAHDKADADYVRGGSAASPSNLPAKQSPAAVPESKFANYSQFSQPSVKRRSQMNGSPFETTSQHLNRASAASSVDLERYHSARSHLSVDSMDLDARASSDTFLRPSQPPVLEEVEYQPDGRAVDSAGSMGMRHSQAPSHMSKGEQPAAGSREEFLMRFDHGWLAFLNKLYGDNAKQVADLQLLPPAPWNRKPGFVVRMHGHRFRDVDRIQCHLLHLEAVA